MGIFGNSSAFDQDVERATSENSTSEEWGLIMEICDRAGASPAAAKECLRCVLRRLAHADPHVQVHAATLLDACVSNCGRLFHLEVASRDFEVEFRRLLARAQPAVAARLRAMLRKWAEHEFRSDPQLDLIPSLHAKLRAEAEPAAAPAPAPAASSAASAASAAAQREQDELARAIALSLRDAPPAALYPRVDAAPPASEGGAPSPSASPAPAAAAAAPSPAAAAAPAAATPPRRVCALYDFEAAEDNELTFLAGEIVHVTDSSDPNWWKGYNARGSGLFPANFVGECSQPRAAAESAAPAEAPPAAIHEPSMDAALALLLEADPSAVGPREAELARLEARALHMGALVDAALQRADRRHARLAQLSSALVDALNLYHSLMRDPLKPPPPPYAAPAQHAPPHATHAPPNAPNAPPNAPHAPPFAPHAFPPQR